MRLPLPLAALGALTMAAIAKTADFPPPSKLPGNAEMPDPTVMLDGTKVTTQKDWEAKRRPELKELFQHYMYGRYPAKPEKVSTKVLFEDAKAFGGKGILREVEITFGPPEWPKIYLLLAVPIGMTPAPCYLGPNFQGNHCLVAEERVRITPDWCYPGTPGVKNFKASAEGRGKVLDVWPFEQIIGRGYAVATFYVGDIQPDRPDVREGMRATMPAPRRGDSVVEDETATIMWWAWGVHRVVDYLVTNKEIMSGSLVVVGHSRLGKTALLAGALDDRISIVIPHQSGCGGAGPSRSKNAKAETVKRINTSFPHWFSTSFKAFNDDTTKLPFDQNCLVAMCAPRPVLMTNAEEDQWANPSGQFDVLKAAVPAYEFYNLAKPLVAEKMPETGTLSADRLGYFIRKGTHSMTPADWKVFMDFGDRWLKP
ncbi:MAG TPA: acetylxylan esterase [Gemmata sp.]|jgi:dienelactone hydrolase|nr:acetylxylan esterase [Gemmata sp.]